jgi:predicted small integral membrane protein
MSIPRTPLSASRCAKAVMLACLSAFAALVAFNNLSDYGSNFGFVQHVLAMDTVLSHSTARWRAIEQPLVWHLAYGLIIACELLAAILLGRGGWALWRARRASPVEFARAKQSALWGVLAGFVLWFGGFMVVGGEWFLMWQSSQWNGQESAFRFYLTLLAVGIFVQQGDD